MKKILLVEDKESLARMLEEALGTEGLECEWSANGSDAVRRLAEGRRYAVILTDLRLPGADGLAVVRQARENDPDCPVIVMTGFGTIETAVEAMRLGAYDFIEKPIDVEHLLLVIRRVREHRDLKTENLLLREEFQKRHDLPSIVGDSPRLQEVSLQIQKVAPTDSTVLLQGESGTGKELFARAIHRLSPRRERPFVAINCAAIPDTLLENELFGHERGSYTGASGRHAGKFELADSGTIFLDEIGELGAAVQAKLLRAVQERQIQRIGGNAPIDVDVRIICATNRDLSEAVRSGRFREDLFFRINVFPVIVPPLRARREDIDPLTSFFIARLAGDLGKPALRISDAARASLRRYDWPGNIRELENCLERAAILCDGDIIEPKDVINVQTVPGGNSIDSAVDLSGTLMEATDRAVKVIEKYKIEEALREARSVAAAAERLGIAPRTLTGKMRELGIEPPE
jgi:DNA-binding NtrC family response regulator